MQLGTTEYPLEWIETSFGSTDIPGHLQRLRIDVRRIQASKQQILINLKKRML